MPTLLLISVLLGFGINLADALAQPLWLPDSANWPTIPQLYVKGEFVGGADIIREMFQAGELKSLFEEKGVAAAA